MVDFHWRGKNRIIKWEQKKKKKNIASQAEVKNTEARERRRILFSVISLYVSFLLGSGILRSLLTA